MLGINSNMDIVLISACAMLFSLLWTLYIDPFLNEHPGADGFVCAFAVPLIFALLIFFVFLFIIFFRI